MPAGEKVAVAFVPPLLLHAYVPPPLAVKVCDAPLQIVALLGAITAVGVVFTVTTADAVAVQLLALATVTVYVVVEAGVKVACALLPPPLLHVYVPPPLAVSICEFPLQMVAVAGVIPAVGFWFTVTVCEAVAEQFAPMLTVTVYVVAEVGETVIEALLPKPPLHA